MVSTQIIAENIKAARIYRNYSQDYLAFKLNISQNSYSKVECGYTKLTVERLDIIARVLEVDPVSLITAPGIQTDIQSVNNIPGVYKLLEVICRVTGMGFTAIARVTEDRWVACAVRDEIAFGLEPGGELKVETTICNEIRHHGRAVIIDHVAEDCIFAWHPTPIMYGFQSYISMPIKRPDGSFFGTLCAIDPKPAKLNNPGIIGLFSLFSEFITLHLQPFQSYTKHILPETKSLQ
jgi:DNA-binding XRE family transcriptional regulator